MSGELQRTVINLNAGKNGVLQEKILYQLAGQIKSMLVQMGLGGISIPGFNAPVSVRGTPNQIDAFMKALRGEKRYMDSYMRNGLNNPTTLKSRHDLNRAVAQFERETGLRWPFSN